MSKKKFIKKQKSNIETFVNKFLSSKIGSPSQPISGIKGLVNLGNTCYFNAMLQILLNSPLFLYQLSLYCSTSQTIFVNLNDQEEYKLELKIDDVSLVESELISLWASNENCVSPSSLRVALLQHKDFKALFNGFNQHDSHEVFLMVLNIIKEAQIKRIRGAILDYFNARTASVLINENTKNKIKQISLVAEKQNFVNTFFGLFVASNLRCENCDEMRMRFDEVLHIAPLLSNTCDLLTMPSSQLDSVVDKSNLSTNPSEKASKHQLKKLKRLEKKDARNKKSVKRNLDCSAECETMVNLEGTDDRECLSQITEKSESAHLINLNGGCDDNIVGHESICLHVQDLVMIDVPLEIESHIEDEINEKVQHVVNETPSSKEQHSTPSNEVLSSILETHHSDQFHEPTTDLDTALGIFNSPISFSNISCEHCSKTRHQKYTNHIKTDVICHLPQILPFYISRFNQSSIKSRIKNSRLYTYPFILNLSSPTSKYANIGNYSRPVLYRLFGIIEHIGATISSGHYVSYVSQRRTECADTSTNTGITSPYPVNILHELTDKHEARNDDQNSDTGNGCTSNELSDYQWFCISDGDVKAVASEKVRHIQAFMLFYSRIQ